MAFPDFLLELGLEITSEEKPTCFAEVGLVYQAGLLTAARLNN